MTASPVAARPDPAVEQRLCEEPIVWVTTVRPDGRPHVVPTWFWWDGSAFLVFSKPHAVKVANLAAQPAAMLAFGDPADDFDVLLVEGEASLVPEPTADLLPEGLLDKYAAWLRAIGLGRAEYVATYSQPVRIVPTRFLPWHGRTPRGSVPAATTLTARRPARGDRPRRRAAASAGARRAVRYVRRPGPASSSVHAPWRPTADGPAPRSRDAVEAHRTATVNLRSQP